MKSKLFSRDEIIAQFHDGQTIMTGGFAFHGLPNELLDCLIASQAPDQYRIGRQLRPAHAHGHL